MASFVWPFTFYQGASQGQIAYAIIEIPLGNRPIINDGDITVFASDTCPLQLDLHADGLGQYREQPAPRRFNWNDPCEQVARDNYGSGAPGLPLHELSRQQAGDFTFALCGDSGPYTPSYSISGAVRVGSDTISCAVSFWTPRTRDPVPGRDDPLPSYDPLPRYDVPLHLCSSVHVLTQVPWHYETMRKINESENLKK